MLLSKTKFSFSQNLSRKGYICYRYFSKRYSNNEVNFLPFDEKEIDLFIHSRSPHLWVIFNGEVDKVTDKMYFTDLDLVMIKS